MRILASCCLLTCLIVIGCGKSDTQVVKDWTMPGYETTTVGKAFNASFDNPEWKQFESEKGEQVVEFNGVISQKLHDTAVAIFLGRDSVEDLKINNQANAKLLVLVQGIALRSLDKEALTALNVLSQGEPNEYTKAYIFVKEYFEMFFWPVNDPVTFQWAISPKDNTPQLTHISSSTWNNLDASDILDIIYS